MSDTGFRYFQDRVTGEVHSVSSHRLITVYTNSPEDYTEVKVVPLDAVVIEGPLPEVTVEGDKIAAGSISWSIKLYRKHLAAIEEDGLAQIAIAAYLREHPPIDEAAVKTAQIALLDLGGYDSETAGSIARDLVAKGYRIEVAS